MLARLFRSSESRLYEILSRIECEIQARRGIAPFLRALDASKQPIMNCLRGRFDSPVVARLLTLKILNLCLAKYHFLDRSTTLLSRPFGLIVDPSNGCNLACPGCVHSTHVKELQLFHWDKGMLPPSRIDAFLRAYGPYAIHINFCNYGEPLLNPETPRYILMAKSYLMQTMLSTNFSIGKLDAEAIVRSGLDYMLVSIDGATQPVYEQFRRNGRIDVVFRNLQNLVEARRKLGSRTPVIAWRYLTFRHNVHEIPQAIEKARELGVDQFLTLQPYDVSWDDPAMQAVHVEPVNILINPRSEDSILGNWQAFIADVDADAVERAFTAAHTAPAEDTGSRGFTCQWLYRSITMDAGGRVFPCCAAPRPDIELVFSKFDGDAADAAYNSPKYRLARLGFRDGPAYQAAVAAASTEREPHCARCDWNKDSVNTDSAQIRQYLKAAAGDLFREGSIQILAGW